MAEQKKARPDQPEGDKASEGGGKKVKKPKDPEKGKELDALIDEIDEALEENAEEFMKSYVQRGGQ